MARVELLSDVDSGFDGALPPGSLCAAPVEDITSIVVNIVNRVEPCVVVVLDGSDGHRDHLRLRTCVDEALESAGVPDISMVETCVRQPRSPRGR